MVRIPVGTVLVVFFAAACAARTPPAASVRGADPCVIDSEDLIMRTAKALVEITQRVGVPLIFKSSYEKDNRGSEKNWKGPMANEGLKILAKVRKEFWICIFWHLVLYPCDSLRRCGSAVKSLWL